MSENSNLKLRVEQSFFVLPIKKLAILIALASGNIHIQNNRKNGQERKYLGKHTLAWISLHITKETKPSFYRDSIGREYCK